jgi:hypothetical protein
MAVQTDPSSAGNATAPTVESTSVAHLPALTHLRCLCRFDDGAVFAYAERGHEFIRASDRELWAVERDGALVSVRSGYVLAQRRGRVYFATDNDAPLYYERAI